MLVNLIKNAIKFTKYNGTISIRACYADGKLTFNVEDSGSGIASDELPKLFTRFGKM